MSAPARRPEGPRLADSLALVLPALPAELAPEAGRPALERIAALLPPVHTAGFECRLAPGADAVDLQQGISSMYDEPAALAGFLDRTGASASPVWNRVRSLCEDWTGISELWLEVDAVPGAAPRELADLLPSVFATLAPEDPSESLAAAHAVLARLVGEEDAEPLAAVLDRCAAACPPGARVSHLGVMLGRSVVALRVHVTGVRLDAIAPYLAEIGWAGDTSEAEALSRVLLDHGDSVVLCFDVVGDLLPRLGLECFFTQKRGVDPRWPPLLARLVELGVAAPEKVGALPSWPGVVTPIDGPAPWPDDLIARSLVEPEETLGIVERRLSHVKLTCAAGGPPSAKVYFGFGHVWHSLVEQPRPSPPAPAVRPAATAAEAIERAVGFLLAARNQGGWWRDFFDRARPRGVDERITGYASDEWVTAYVANAMAGAADATARDAARQALELLLARRDAESGWGYHALLPADADTTTWVLRLAEQLGVAAPGRLPAARRFVEGLTAPDGGVATYRQADAGRLAEFLEMDGPYDGWCAIHTCVTAAAAVLDPGRLQFLLREQRPDGSWAGHWWDDDEYTTARAAEALARHEGHAEAVARARTWAAGRLADDGAVHSPGHGGPSPFATALAVQALVVCGDGGDVVRRAAAWLLSQQREDGSWEPSARLRVPAPAAVDPLATPETTLTYVDDEGLFTTATVLAALGSAA